jgi:hypothetical protein
MTRDSRRIRCVAKRDWRALSAGCVNLVRRKPSRPVLHVRHRGTPKASVAGRYVRSCSGLVHASPCHRKRGSASAAGRTAVTRSPARRVPVPPPGRIGIGIPPDDDVRDADRHQLKAARAAVGLHRSSTAYGVRTA